LAYTVFLLTDSPSNTAGDLSLTLPDDVIVDSARAQLNVIGRCCFLLTLTYFMVALVQLLLPQIPSFSQRSATLYSTVRQWTPKMASKAVERFKQDVSDKTDDGQITYGELCGNSLSNFAENDTRRR